MNLNNLHFDLICSLSMSKISIYSKQLFAANQKVTNIEIRLH